RPEGAPTRRVSRRGKESPEPDHAIRHFGPGVDYEGLHLRVAKPAPRAVSKHEGVTEPHLRSPPAPDASHLHFHLQLPVREPGTRAPGGIRTPDPQIRSLPLYPLSYGRVLR